MKESRFFMDVKDRALRITEQKKVKEVPFKVYHQNIRSLRRKYQELLCISILTYLISYVLQSIT